MPINIYWIRHGLSCANIHKYVHAVIHDPSLTPHGVLSSKNANVPEHPDYVLCSELLRAKQTASIAYSDRFIHVTPHTGELGFGLDNVSSGFENQYSKIGLDKFIHLPYDNQCKNFKMYLEKYFVSSNKEKPIK